MFVLVSTYFGEVGKLFRKMRLVDVLFVLSSFS